jgi:hypothetical protein
MKENKDYLRKRNRSNNHYNKNKNGQKPFSIEFSQPNIDENETPAQSNDIIKIGKHWEGINKIEPKNTSGKIYFYEKENVFLSIVENTLRIFDMIDLKLLKTIKQVIFFKFRTKRM